MVVDVSPSGEIRDPMAAVRKVRQLRREGKIGPYERVTVRFAPGRYFLKEPVNLGEHDSHLVFEGAADGSTVLTGASEVGPFVAGKDGIWRAKVSKGVDFEDFWVNGRRADRARSPNKGYYYIRQSLNEGTDEKGEVVDWSRRAFVASNPDDLKPLAALPKDELATVAVQVYYSWDTDWLRCERVLPDRGILVLSSQSRRDFFDWKSNETRFVIENFRAALDAPGEWYLDRKAGEVLYIPRPGESVKNAVGTYGAVRELVRVRNLVEKPIRDVLFHDIAFEGTGYASGLSVPGGQGATGLGAAVFVEHAWNVSFTGCRFTHVAEWALVFGRGCHACDVSECVMDDLGGGGVRIGGDRWQADTPPDRASRFVRVSDCVLTRGGRRFPGAVGVLILHASDCTVEHNEIADFYYTGVSVGWTWGYGETVAQRNLIAFNRIRDIGRGVLSDMGGIYTLGKSIGTQIIGNVITDVYSYDYTGDGSTGIYTDEGSTGILFASNVVSRVRTAPLNQHYGRGNVFVNNVFAWPEEAEGKCAAVLGRPETPCSLAMTNNVFIWKGKACAFLKGAAKHTPQSCPSAHNLFWSCGTDASHAFAGGSFSEWQARGFEWESVFADPHFRDPEKDDFTPMPGSPALGLGFRPIDVKLAGPRKPALRALASRCVVPPAEPPPVPKLYEGLRSRSTGFEGLPVGATPSFFSVVGKSVAITNVNPRSGKKCVVVTETPGQDVSWYPHLNVKFVAGETFRLAYSIRYDAGVSMVATMREWKKTAANGQYAVGPALLIRDGKMSVDGCGLLKTNPGTWYDVVFCVHSKRGARTTFDVTVSDVSGVIKSEKGIRADAEFFRPDWFGFISESKTLCSFYIDDFSFGGMDDNSTIKINQLHKEVK